MIHLVKIEDKHQYVVCGVLGSDAVKGLEEAEQLYNNPAYEGELPNPSDTLGEEMFRFFDTATEARAYIQGLTDSIGNMGHQINEDWEFHTAVFPDSTNGRMRYISKVQ